MLYPLPKNVYSLCLVSTLVITTHPPRCCEVRARLVADKLANGKEPKDARRGCAIAIAIVRRWSLGIFRKRVQHTNTSSMSSGSTTSLFYRDLGARWQHDDSRWRPKSVVRKKSERHCFSASRAPPDLSGLERGGNAVDA
jgi:hypothetical protein